MPSTVVATYGENAYAEVAQIAQALEGFSVPAAFSANDNQELKRVLVEVSQFIDSVTGKYFGKYSRSEVFSGDGTPHLWLSQVTALALLSLSEVKFRETFVKTYDWDASGAVVDEDSYDVTDSGRCVVRVGGSTEGARYADSVAGEWVKGYKNYRLTGMWGVSEIPVPIERAAIVMVRERTRPGYLKVSEAFLREKWADGYEYERQGRFTNPIPQYTGYEIVDRLLHPFVSDDPEVGFTVVK